MLNFQIGMQVSTISFKEFLEGQFEIQNLIDDDLTLEDAREFVLQYEAAAKRKSPWGIRFMFVIIFLIFCGCSFIIIVYALKMQMETGALGSDFLFDALLAEAQDTFINNPLEILFTTYLAVGIIAKFATLRNNRILNRLLTSDMIGSIKKARIKVKKRRESARGSVKSSPLNFTTKPLESKDERERDHGSKSTSAVVVEMANVASWSAVHGLSHVQLQNLDEEVAAVAHNNKDSKKTIVDIIPGASNHVQRVQEGIKLRPPVTERRTSVAFIKPPGDKTTPGLPQLSSNLLPTFLRRSSRISGNAKDASSARDASYSP